MGEDVLFRRARLGPDSPTSMLLALSIRQRMRRPFISQIEKLDHPSRASKRDERSPLRRTPSHSIQDFRTNSAFSFIAPIPSMRQSISWSPSTMRIFLTRVPIFTTEDDPRTFSDFTTVTLSPS